MISNSLIMLKGGGCEPRYLQTPFLIVGSMKGFGAESSVTEGLGGSDAVEIVSSYINVVEVAGRWERGWFKKMRRRLRMGRKRRT